MKRNKRGSLAYREAFLNGRLGIRGRLLLDLAVLVGFIISLVWFCQIALLMNFYRADRTGQVRRAAGILKQNIDHDDLESLADRVSADNDLCLILADEEGNVQISIDHVRTCLLHQMGESELRQLMGEAPEDGSGKFITRGITLFKNDRYDRESYAGAAPENGGRSGLSLLYVQRLAFQSG